MAHDYLELRDSSATDKACIMAKSVGLYWRPQCDLEVGTSPTNCEWLETCQASEVCKIRNKACCVAVLREEPVEEEDQDGDYDYAAAHSFHREPSDSSDDAYDYVSPRKRRTTGRRKRAPPRRRAASKVCQLSISCPQRNLKFCFVLPPCILDGTAVCSLMCKNCRDPVPINQCCGCRAG